MASELRPRLMYAIGVASVLIFVACLVTPGLARANSGSVKRVQDLGDGQPPPPPTLIAPDVGAMLTIRSSVTFLASDAMGAYRESEIEVAGSDETDPDGTLANAHPVELGTTFSDSAGRIEYTSMFSWPRQPGTYYWQLRRTNCAETAACNSEIRSLTIVPPALRLSVAARSRQRLKPGYHLRPVRASPGQRSDAVRIPTRGGRATGSRARR